MTTGESDATGATRTRSIVAVVLALLVIGGLTAVLRFDANPRSAELGREGTRSFEGTPDDLPTDIVPPDALEVEGTVARQGANWTSAVTFVLAGNRDEVRSHVEGVLAANDWVQRQRSFDDQTFQAIYDRNDGAVLTVTHQTTAQGTGTAVVLEGPPSGGSS